MLVEKEYKRNAKTGEIVKREIVEIICDKCGKNWESVYSNRKRKSLEEDLCGSCRSKVANTKTRILLSDLRWGREKREKIEITCKNCGVKKLKIPSLVTEGNHFCSIPCKIEYWNNVRYGHLFEEFEKHPNEVAYLIGLILGDGHLKKHAKENTRVSIAFDYSGKWTCLLDLSKSVLGILKIQWYEEPKSHKSCKMIGFVLPDVILKKYGILYSGDKFKCQPYPCEDIRKNINYASGLLNSDGCFSERKKGRAYYFSNTVKSITSSLSDCLKINNVKFGLHNHKGVIDKRTGNLAKDQYNLYICGEENISILHKLCSFKMKGNI